MLLTVRRRTFGKCLNHVVHFLRVSVSRDDFGFLAESLLTLESLVAELQHASASLSWKWAIALKAVGAAAMIQSCVARR